MWHRWFPWKYLIRRAARKHGFLDPITLMTRLRRFAQPAEVSEPVELIRAGALFHARGLINTRAIQHNLDWVWPYWVEQQFDPHSKSFIPRAFSVTHINMTHRDWTALGIPNCDAFPVVDPRGLVTPFWDGWSLDAWIVPDDGKPLLPSKATRVRQTCGVENDRLTVWTTSREGSLELALTAWMEIDGGVPVCRIHCDAQSGTAAALVLSLRPYNPEGVSLVHSIKLAKDRQHWKVAGKQAVELSEAPDRHFTSNYKTGDVFRQITNAEPEDSVTCNVGLATAAAVYPLEAGRSRSVEARVDLSADPQVTALKKSPATTGWKDALADAAALNVPDKKITTLYHNAVRTLVLMSPDWAYPGPYTYKRFWYRDAALMVHGLLSAGLTERARRVIDKFPEKQSLSGFFHSQEGEWDANGEVLWVVSRYCRITRETPPRRWLKSIRLGGDWILDELLTEAKGALHEGLLPAGFSAEHFGNIDYYYWDDFWALAGLREGAQLIEDEDPKRALKWRQAADKLWDNIWTSLERSRNIRNMDAFPASPHRRMDSGAIGSLAAGYPLQLVPADCRELLSTADYLLDESFVNGAFFQDMVHSGLNAYLSLHVAQVLLRAGDPRYLDIVHTVRDLASPTGNWPEAIHPITGGGCMGDGHHAWAAGEWIAMIRNMFVLEEGERLILCAGIPDEWLQKTHEPLTFGPTLTPHGKISITIDPREKPARVKWDAEWFGEEPEIEIRGDFTAAFA